MEQKEVSGLRLRNTLTHDESTLPVSAMFLGIGHDPNAKMFRGLIDLDDDGYITHHGPGVHPGAWSVCMRGRAGPALSAGDHGCRFGMRGGARGGEIP